MGDSEEMGVGWSVVLGELGRSGRRFESGRTRTCRGEGLGRREPPTLEGFHPTRTYPGGKLSFGEMEPVNLSNSKKKSALHGSGFEIAGAVARLRRGGSVNRAGRRSALLGFLTAAYANSSRGGRNGADTSRTGSDRA